MKPAAGTSARDSICFYLKTKGPQTAAQLAARLDVTTMAVRQHLAVLETEGAATYDVERRAIGRPAHVWRLTEAARTRFPDSHAELSAGIIAAARAAFGTDGLAKLIAERTKQQTKRYRERLPGPKTPLAKRVAALAALRKEEGYLAEWSRQRDGAFVLIENHCPICVAARACQGLCDGEIELFRGALGRGVQVERTEHLLANGRRCVYRIRG